MVIKKEKPYYKRLVITEDRINELEEILKNYCDVISYDAKTSSKTSLSFESREELLAYDNFVNGKITSLDISCRSKDYSTSIDIRFAPETRVRNETALCNYRFSDSDNETLFVKAWENYLKKSTEYQSSYILCRCASFLFCFSLCLFLVLRFFNTKLRFVSVFLLAYFLVFSTINALSHAKPLWEKVFPPAEFPWGEEKEKYAKQITRRSNMFWNVVIPTLLSIAFEILSIVKMLGK